jgi:hypothetical protein
VAKGTRTGEESAADARARLERYERDFRRAGLPMFSEDFSAAEDVFNRAAPLLGLVFFAEIVGAVDLDWSWWQNALAMLAGLAFLLVAFGLINKAKGRPFSAIPERLGRAELAGFVLIPALLPVLANQQWTSAWVTAAANLALLGLIYAVGALGLLHVIRWVMKRFAGQLSSALGLIATAIPLLAIFALLSFTTQELWEIFSSVDDAIYATILCLFFLLGAVFLIARVPKETRRLEADAGAGTPPLRRRQLLNVGVVMFVSQALQVLIVSVSVGLFFALFGLLAIDEGIREQWIGSAGNELFAVSLFGERLEVTEELLRVAGGLAAFSGFYFAISMLTDSTYRDEFLEEMTSEMRQSFAERAEYLEMRERAGGAT